MLQSSQAAILWMLALSLLGCRGEHGFESRGRYRAAVSGCEIVVRSAGVISPADDLAGDALALGRLCPLPGGPGTPRRFTLRVESHGEIAFHDLGASRRSAPWTFRTGRDLLAAMLQDAGYPSPDDGELESVARLVESSLLGPKGHVSAPQPDIEIVETSSRYDDAAAGRAWLDEPRGEADWPTCAP